MKISFYNSGISFTKAMQEYASNKLSILEKYEVINEKTPVKVTVEKEDLVKKLKIIVNTKKTIVAETSDPDYYAAIDRAVDILERQIRHIKEKRVEKHRRVSYFKTLDLAQDVNLDSFLTKKAQKALKGLENQRNATDGEIVKEKYIYLDEISQEEAISRMLELNHDFFVYRDDILHKVCIVYIRFDGNYGLLICH